MYKKTKPGTDSFPDTFMFVTMNDASQYETTSASIESIPESYNGSYTEFVNSRITNCIEMDARWTNITANCYRDQKMYIYNASFLCPKPNANLELKKQPTQYSTAYDISDASGNKLAKITHSIYEAKPNTSQDIRYKDGAKNIIGYNVDHAGEHSYDKCKTNNIQYTDIFQIYPESDHEFTADMLSQNFHVVNFTFADKTEMPTNR